MLVEGLVSTIVPVHNRPTLLREAIASVLAQTYRPIEIFIVDDGSTDTTGCVAEELARLHPEIQVIHQANAGPGSAREAARGVICGEFVQHLDSDDLLLPMKFQQQVEALRLNPRSDVCYGKTRYYVIGDTPINVPWKRTGELIQTMFPSFLQSRWWDTSTPLYRRDVIDRAGSWLGLSSEEDWEYDCRIASFGGALCYSDIFVSDTRGHRGEGLSGSVNSTTLKHRALAHERILQHAIAAGITLDAPEMKLFARELFLLARQCGAHGLVEESKGLFSCARRASGIERGNAADFRLYNFACRLFGWRGAGRISGLLDRFRR